MPNKKKNKNSNSKQIMMVMQPSLGLPDFDSTVRTRKVFRFTSATSGDIDVTYARLGGLYVMAGSTVTSFLFWDRLRLKGVRMFGTSGVCDIAATFAGSAAGQVGDNVTHSDSSVGNTYIAKIPKGTNNAAWLKPPKLSQASQWQLCTAAATGICFTLTVATSVYIDIMVEYAGPTKSANKNFAGPALAAATLGDIVFVGLDGLPASTSMFDPVGVTNIA